LLKIGENRSDFPGRKFWQKMRRHLTRLDPENFRNPTKLPELLQNSYINKKNKEIKFEAISEKLIFSIFAKSDFFFF
jgi:hypothetical protein